MASHPEQRRKSIKRERAKRDALGVRPSPYRDAPAWWPRMGRNGAHLNSARRIGAGIRWGTYARLILTILEGIPRRPAGYTRAIGPTRNWAQVFE